MKTRHDPSSKPYYKCLSCDRFRKTCGGMPTRGMDLHEWCEYMRDIKEVAHLTNAFISKEADVSIKTIERIMAINFEQDIMRATARRIELAVIGPVSKHFCYQDNSDSATTDSINALQVAVEHLREENARYAAMLDQFLNRK